MDPDRDDGPTPFHPVEQFPALESVEAALIAAFRDPSVRLELRGRVDGLLRFDLPSGGTAECDLRSAQRVRVARDNSVLVRIEPTLLNEFLLGRTHEPLLLANGSVKIDGPALVALRCLTGLDTIGQAYRRHLGAVSGDASRFAVLRAFPVYGWETAGFGPRDVLRHDQRHDQLALAAVLLTGLPPSCRLLEISALVEGRRGGTLDRGELVALCRVLCEMTQIAAGGSGSIADLDSSSQLASVIERLEVEQVEGLLSGLADHVASCRDLHGALAAIDAFD